MGWSRSRQAQWAAGTGLIPRPRVRKSDLGPPAVTRRRPLGPAGSFGRLGSALCRRGEVLGPGCSDWGRVCRVLMPASGRWSGADAPRGNPAAVGHPPAAHASVSRARLGRWRVPVTLGCRAQQVEDVGVAGRNVELWAKQSAAPRGAPYPKWGRGAEGARPAPGQLRDLEAGAGPAVPAGSPVASRLREMPRVRCRAPCATPVTSLPLSPESPA